MLSVYIATVLRGLKVPSKDYYLCRYVSVFGHWTPIILQNQKGAFEWESKRILFALVDGFWGKLHKIAERVQRYVPLVRRESVMSVAKKRFTLRIPKSQ